MVGFPAALSSAGGIRLSVSGLTKQCPKTMSFSRHYLPSSTCFSTLSSPGDSSAAKPWLLAGLGNPGKIYQGTRHNVGFEMIDTIAEAEGISVANIHCKALLGKGCIGDVPVILAKPQTFMNLSGESVGLLVSYFKIPLNQVLLMYDDLDLPFAKLRLLPKGGHGGQNGMRSVINHLKGSRNFPRLRIVNLKTIQKISSEVSFSIDEFKRDDLFLSGTCEGIGRPPGRMDPAVFVLKPFTKKEREEMDFTLQRGVEAVRILLLQGFNRSASFVNAPQPSELLN